MSWGEIFTLLSASCLKAEKSGLFLLESTFFLFLLSAAGEQHKRTESEKKDGHDRTFCFERQPVSVCGKVSVTKEINYRQEHTRRKHI